MIQNNNDKGGFKKSLSMIEDGSTRAMRGKKLRQPDYEGVLITNRSDVGIGQCLFFLEQISDFKKSVVCKKVLDVIR